MATMADEFMTPANLNLLVATGMTAMHEKLRGMSASIKISRCGMQYGLDILFNDGSAMRISIATVTHLIKADEMEEVYKQYMERVSQVEAERKGSTLQ